ncbi:hypothetical protein [Paenibacillus graminis]|uniref:hypothetical protein n=1 Tax=Paenibacillus graminis TaxID=189425 RepID=UPI002DB7AC53|nr:hypothetical protein [Paenibacillus graminis]MEC0173002.1 hypothetical protein [Paenibacillus graminis]
MNKNIIWGFVVTVSLLSGCSANETNQVGSPTFSPEAVKEATEPTLEPSFIPTAAPTIDPKVVPSENPTPSSTLQKDISINGTGDQSETFNLNPGIAIFDINYTGEGNVYFDLLSPNGDTDLLAAKRGQYKGRVYKKITESGEYSVNVNSKGSWSMSVSQNYPKELLQVPSSLTGKGDEVYFINLTEGNIKFSLKNKGEKMFMVELDGRLLGVENGNYTGSKTLSIDKAGVYPITIKSDGQWTITIE